MSGPEVGDAAVQGPEEIADAFVWPRDRFALDLIEHSVARRGGQARTAGAPVQCLAREALAWRGRQPKGVTYGTLSEDSLTPTGPPPYDPQRLDDAGGRMPPESARIAPALFAQVPGWPGDPQITEAR